MQNIYLSYSDRTVNLGAVHAVNFYTGDHAICGIVNLNDGVSLVSIGKEESQPYVIILGNRVFVGKTKVDRIKTANLMAQPLSATGFPRTF